MTSANSTRTTRTPRKAVGGNVIPILRLVQSEPNQKLIAALRGALERAEKGESVGMGLVEHLGGNNFRYYGVGSLTQNPDLGRRKAMELAACFE